MDSQDVEALVKAIIENGAVRDFDKRVLFLSILALISSSVGIWITWKLNKKQIEIASNQTLIADKQTAIMEEQNKIALFEKRYEAYHEISCNLLKMNCFSSDCKLHELSSEEAKCVVRHFNEVANKLYWVSKEEMIKNEKKEFQEFIGTQEIKMNNEYQEYQDFREKKE